MNPWIAGEVGTLVGALLLGAACEAARTAILTVPRLRLRQAAASGEYIARGILALADPPEPLSRSMVIVLTVLRSIAAVSGAALALTACHPDGLAAARGASSWSLTLTGAMGILLANLVWMMAAERLPQHLGAAHSHAVARVAYWPVRIIVFVVAPLAAVIEAGGRAMLRACGLANWSVNPDPELKRLFELQQLVEAEGQDEDTTPDEQRLAVEALRLGDRIVRQIMRPRIEIDAADVATPAQEVLGVVAMAGFSRLPVYEGDLDHIIGFVHLKDVLRQHYLGWPLDLRKLTRQALFVPDTMRVDRLLMLLQEKHSSLAIVVDEFGGTKGMVTLYDVLAELVGEIASVHTSENEKIVPRDERSWVVAGTVSIDDLLDFLNQPELRDSAPRNVATVAGLVIVEFGRLPAVGDKITWHTLEFEVLEVDGQRIDRVLVALRPETEPHTD